MELSIIIPAYNCIETIEHTLSSIAIQKLPINYEVILVNDCSNYDYSNIISHYDKKINIREIRTIKNIGPGGARQFGIDNSASDYIIFIDGDDCFYDSKSVLKMYNEIKRRNVDLVIGNFIYEHNDKVLIKQEDFIYLHGKIYKRKFLNDNNIRFNETRSNEDAGFNTLISLLNPKVCFFNETVYVYKENPNSITRENIKQYQYDGLQNLSYNMNWAIDEAMKRKEKVYGVYSICLNVLVSLYFHYIALQYEFDVHKILIWAKDIFIKYKNSYYKNNKKELETLIQDNKLFYETFLDIKEYNISFFDFLQMIEKAN